MKTLLILVIIAFTPHSNSLTNAIWTCRMGNDCVNTLKLKENNKLTEYDCELRYMFTGSYRITKDTLIITEKYNAHSGNHGKVIWCRTKNLIKKDALKRLSTERLSNGKWINVKTEPDEINYYRVR